MGVSEAADIGLVDEAVPEAELRSRVEQLAKRLAGMPAAGVTQTKKLLNQMSPLRRFEWDEAASEAFRDCYARPEARARIAQFLDRKAKR